MKGAIITCILKDIHGSLRTLSLSQIVFNVARFFSTISSLFIWSTAVTIFFCQPKRSSFNGINGCKKSLIASRYWWSCRLLTQQKITSIFLPFLPFFLFSLSLFSVFLRKICQIDSKFVDWKLEYFYKMPNPFCPTSSDRCHTIALNKVVS